MNRSTAQLVTAERFEAGIAALGVRIDSLNIRMDSVDARIEALRSDLLARIDTLPTELRADFMRAQMLFVGVVIAANALMLAIFGLLLSRGAI